MLFCYVWCIPNRNIWIENGEIQFPVEEVTIAGNLKEMFQSILAIGSDIDTKQNIRSGSILMDSLAIAGQ